MNLELNHRIIFRMLDQGAMLYDPDTRKAMKLNAAGITIYRMLRSNPDSEAVIEAFSGGDADKRRDAERFLAMLQHSCFLAGFSGSEPPLPSTENPDEPHYGIGFSMTGTMTSGDKLDMRRVPLDTLRRGDVISFSDGGKMICHRIIGGSCGNWITMGDHNARPDRNPVTPESDPFLVVGLTRNGRYIPVSGSWRGICRFAFLQSVRISKAALRAALLPLQDTILNCCFWRKKADRATTFGRVVQYSCNGRVIGWRIGKIRIFRRFTYRFLYCLPALEKKP